MQKQETKLKNPQDIQDNIIRKMTAEQKVKTASALTAFCLKLNKLNQPNGQNNKSDAIFK